MPPTVRPLFRAIAVPLTLMALFCAASGTAKELQRQGKGNKSFLALVIIGDRDVVYDLRGWQAYEASVMAAPLSDADVKQVGNDISGMLKDAGYVLADVQLHKAALSAKLLAYRVNLGTVGTISVSGNKYYSADQIIRNIDAKSGTPFNYRDLYSNMFDLNVKPDVQVDTTLAAVDGEDGKTVNLEIAVEDRLPWHIGLNLSNTGSEATSDWRLRTTVQGLNVSKHDDIFTLEYLTDPADSESVNGVSSSYRFPLDDNSVITVYGGWSESDLDDVLQDLDIYGQGYFGGFRLSHIVKSTPQYDLDLSYGYTFQYIENATDFADVPFERDEVRLGMPSVALGYSGKSFDRWGGRNFASLSMLWNMADKLGSDDAEDFERNQPDADGNLTITKAQVARLQRITLGDDDSPMRKWTLFTRVDGQYTRDKLIPALRYGIGGADSVRGYREREINGDAGMRGTIELRTPLLSNFIGDTDDEDWYEHRLQLVTFADLGYVYRNDPRGGLQREDSLSSIGLGLRLNITKYLQMKVDYGHALTETEESRHGRGHFSVQAQF
jgi:hemolysin activation/secretion protein